MKELCNQCGMCCKAVHLNEDMDRVKEIAESIQSKYKNDAIFIRDNWKQISVQDFKKINPYMFNKLLEKANEVNTKGFTDDEKVINYCKLSFYTCSKLIDNKCSVYEIRPNVCSQYPLYDYRTTLTKHEIFYDKDCGYKELIVEDEISNDELKRI